VALEWYVSAHIIIGSLFASPAHGRCCLLRFASMECVGPMCCTARSGNIPLHPASGVPVSDSVIIVGEVVHFPKQNVEAWRSSRSGPDV